MYTVSRKLAGILQGPDAAPRFRMLLERRGGRERIMLIARDGREVMGRCLGDGRHRFYSLPELVGVVIHIDGYEIKIEGEWLN